MRKGVPRKPVVRWLLWASMSLTRRAVMLARRAFGGDAGVEGDDVGALRVAGDGAVGLDVLLAVGFGDVVVEGLVFFGVFFAAEGEGHFVHVAGDDGPVGGGDEVFGGVLVGGEPVAVVVAELVAAEVVGVGCEDEVHVALHVGPGGFEEGFVAVLEPGGVGDEDAGVGPAGCAGLRAEEVGGDVGEGVVGGLGVVDVEHELAGEAGDVEVVGAGAPEDAGVAHPAETLVALGAVGGDGEEVAALAPDAELAHLVEEIAGALEADGGGGGEAVVDEAFDAGGGGSAGVAGELDVAEAVEGEGGGVGLVAVAGEDVGVGHRGVAEVFGVDAAVGVEAFGEAHAHERCRGGRGRGGRCCRPCSGPCRRRRGGLALAGFIEMGWRVLETAMERLGWAVSLTFGRRWSVTAGVQLGGGEVRGVPAGGFEARVVDFAGVDLGEEGGGGGGLPGFVGGDGFVRAVGEGDVELGAEGVGFGVGASAGPGHGGAVPAAAEDCGDGVVAGGEERR